MADEPLRIRILNAIADTLASIHPDLGYRYDLTAKNVWFEGTPDEQTDWRHVVWGRAIFGDDDPLPILSILEVPIPLDQAIVPPDSPYSSGDWELLVQGFVEDDIHHPTRPAHRLMADVKRVLALEKRKNMDFNIFGMGEDVRDLRIGAGVVRPPDEVSSKAYFWLDLTVSLAEDLTNPYD